MDFMITLLEGLVANLATWLQKNPLALVILFILAILGALGNLNPLSIILNARSKKTKLLCHEMRSTNLVSDLLSKIGMLEIYYSSQVIENLTATKIMSWNAGNDIIGSQDIARADPIVITAQTGIKILDAKILHEKTPINQFSVVPDESQSSVRLDFGFVDKNEYIVIALLHTGKLNDNIQISGTIKGGRLVSSTPVPHGQD